MARTQIPPTDIWRNDAFRRDAVSGTATQGYGSTGFEAFHDGIDIVLPPVDYFGQNWGANPPVHTPISGEVIKAGWYDGYGNVVEIKDSNGYRLLMGHLYDRNVGGRPGLPDPVEQVHVGDRLYAGQVIGHQGSTGNSTGPHVHFRLHDANDSSVNPAPGTQPWAHDGGGPLAYPTQTAFIYAMAHDLGMGAGDNPGQHWATTPPPPLFNEAPVVRPLRLPGGGNDPFPSGGGGAVLCDASMQVPKLANGSCPPGYIETSGSSSASACCPESVGTIPGQNCYTVMGQQICVPSNPLGSITQSIASVAVALGVAAVGLVFIVAGLIALTKEGPVKAVTEPVITGTKATVKTVAKVAAVAA